ncbi:hypothetical protein [Fluviicola chungangensis]|uniref:Uncharacterized protein n=1 Tax=Fluviicola chungangensis TaxID=2597671 RepID=A0A556N6A9_9FLAO|nr:hypothetical protein [Fluviicola chungangensis]TSJ47722.1 hypothetical protein FO442_00925 [Fluviicola chungangensis]
MQLYCKKCNQQLTVMDLQQVSSRQINMKKQASLIDPGLYVNASEAEIYFEKQIDFLVNKQSVVLQDHNDPERFSGCCGPGNLSVLNQVCPKCSAEIGVIVEDCIFPYFIGISGYTVSTEPLW